MNHFSLDYVSGMTKIVPFEVVKALRDADDEAVKEKIVEYLEVTIDRIRQGTTVAVLLIEFHDDVGLYTPHMLGMSEYDSITTLGLLKMIGDDLSEDLRHE